MGLFKESSFKEVTQHIIDSVKCKYKVFNEDCTIKQVNDAYMKELERGKKEGFFPVLVPCDYVLEEWFGILDDDNYSLEDTLKARSDNGESILNERYQEYLNDFFEDSDGDLKEFFGEIDNGDEIDVLSAFMKHTGNGIEETILFEIPVDKPWKVIAYLPIGGWNECPAPPEMIAVCRYWYEKYGAVPAVITHDVMEFILDKPVSDKDEALKLAKEHYAFTPDRVDQCTATGTLGEVADCIRKSRVWYFWWD